jgi:hypothetical protein
MSESVINWINCNANDVELLKLRFPEREHDYGAAHFFGPVSDEELRWADLGHLVEGKIGKFAERWFMGFDTRYTKEEALASCRDFVNDLWKERNWPPEGIPEL